MKYIYQIITGNKCYIGQSSASDNDSFSRIRYHIRAAYLKNGGDASEPELLESIRRHNLNELKINIFTEPNYGFDEEVYQNFFKYLRPYGSRITSKIFKGSNDTIDEVEEDFKYTELMKLDAAEILHIANAFSQKGYKVVNAEMGGQYYGGCLTGAEDSLILQRAFKPEEALRVLNYVDSKLSYLQQEVDTFFSNGLDRSSYGKDLQLQINAEAKYNTKKTGKDFIFNLTSKGFGNPETQKGAGTSFSYALKKHFALNIPNKKLVLRRVNGINETLAQTISDSFGYRIRQFNASHKETKDINEYINQLFSEKTFMSGKQLTLSFSQLVDLERSGLPSAGGGKRTSTPTYTEKDSILMKEIKKLACEIFHKFYLETVEPDIYEFNKSITINDRVLVFPQHISSSNTLSKRIHDLYRKDITADFVTNTGEDFYGPMISYTINKYKNAQGEIEQDEENDRSLIFRENKILTGIEGNETVKGPVAHSIKPERADIGLIDDMSQIIIY